MLESLTQELKQSRAFEDVMREFAKVVTSDSDLQSRLETAVDSGISLDEFRDLYVAAAADHGLSFTSDQMEIAMHEQKQGKDKVLPSMVQKLVTIL